MSFQPRDTRLGNDFHTSRDGITEVTAIAVERKSGRSRSRLLLAMFVTAVILCVFAMRVSGQEAVAAENGGYDSVPMHQLFANGKMDAQVIAAAKSYCAGGSTNPNLVKAYFQRYVPAKMTGPDALKDLTPLMKEVNVLLARSQRSKPFLGKAVADLLLPPMNALAKGNYHPTARINAALILGRMDSAPADTAGRIPPKPYLAALPILVDVYKDENNVDGLRVAALLGLQRQVGLGFNQIPAAGRDQLRSMMTELLDSKTPVSRTDRVHAYVQRYAVDILEQLGSSEDEGKQLGVKLIGISTAPEQDELIALYSAAKIGSLGGSLKGQVTKPEDVLERWARLAHDAFQSEVQRLNSLERTPPTSNQPIKPLDVLRPKVDKSKKSYGGGMGGPDLEDGEDGAMGGMEGGMEGMGMGGEGYGDALGDGMDDDELMGGMGGMGSMLGGQTTVYKDQPAEVIGSRRYLNKVLQQLNRGATGSITKGVPKNGGGLMLCVDEAKADTVKDWVVKLDEVITALNSEALDDREKFLGGLDEQIIVLAELANIEAGEKKTAKPDADDNPAGGDVLNGPQNPAADDNPSGGDVLDGPQNPAAEADASIPGTPAPANPAPGNPAPGNPAPGNPAPAAPENPATENPAPAAPENSAPNAP